jgi:hypothetical protein
MQRLSATSAANLSSLTVADVFPKREVLWITRETTLHDALKVGTSFPLFSTAAVAQLFVFFFFFFGAGSFVEGDFVFTCCKSWKTSCGRFEANSELPAHLSLTILFCCSFFCTRN